jgi:hypothetical protein
VRDGISDQLNLGVEKIFKELAEEEEGHKIKETMKRR